MNASNWLSQNQCMDVRHFALQFTDFDVGEYGKYDKPYENKGEDDDDNERDGFCFLIELIDGDDFERSVQEVLYTRHNVLLYTHKVKID